MEQVLNTVMMPVEEYEDLRAQVAALTQERKNLYNQITHYCKQLTASQAREKVLREESEMKPVAWQHRQRGPSEDGWQEWRTVGHTPQGPESPRFQMRPLFTADQLKAAKVEVLREAASKTFCNDDRYMLLGMAVELERK